MDWFKKHKIISGILIFFLVIIIVGAVGSSSTGTPNTNVETESAGQTTVTNQPKEDATPRVGDVTKLGDRVFIVNSVRRSGAFDYNTPKAGKEFVIVNVTIRNLGKNEVSYNPFDFKVK